MKNKSLVEDSPEENTKGSVESKVNSVDEAIRVEKQNNEVVVHATAVIENTPGEIITQADVTNLKNLIFREKHLQQNIVKLEFGRQQSEFRNSTFKHSLEIKLFVSTQQLWEGPRSYIWKHLGQSEWSKANGSSVAFNRIHVKT